MKITYFTKQKVENSKLGKDLEVVEKDLKVLNKQVKAKDKEIHDHKKKNGVISDNPTAFKTYFVNLTASFNKKGFSNVKLQPLLKG